MKRLLVIICLAISVTGCNNGEEKNSPQNLIGNWQEVQEPAFSFDVYYMALTQDSFYIKIARFEDGIIPNHPCGDLQSSRTDYALGTYSGINNILEFDGQFVDECKQRQQNTCYSVGVFKEKFSFKFKGKELVLQEVSGNSPSFRLQPTTNQHWPCKLPPANSGK